MNNSEIINIKEVYNYIPNNHNDSCFKISLKLK